jgi:hypothetical protein
LAKLIIDLANPDYKWCPFTRLAYLLFIVSEIFSSVDLTHSSKMSNPAIVIIEESLAGTWEFCVRRRVKI